MHADIIDAQMQHCLVQDTVAQHILKDRVDGCNMLVTNVEPTLNIDANVGRDTHMHMEIEETPRSFVFLQTNQVICNVCFP